MYCRYNTVDFLTSHPLKGDHFGEKALKTTNNKRTASVQVVSDVAQCLIITKADVQRLIGDIEDVYPDRPVDKKISGSGNVRHSIEVSDSLWYLN